MKTIKSKWEALPSLGSLVFMIFVGCVAMALAFLFYELTILLLLFFVLFATRKEIRAFLKKAYKALVSSIPEQC